MSDTDPFPPPPDGPGSPAPTTEDAPAERRRPTVQIWIGLAVLVVLLGVAALALGAPDDPPAAGPSGPLSPSSGQVSPSHADTVGVAIDGTARTEPLPEGAPIPGWTAPTLDGHTFVWADRPSGPTLLAVWAPWCPHCQAELPRLSAAIGRHPAISLITIATAVDAADGPTPQEYLDSEGLDFTVGLDDQEGTLAIGLGVQAFPTTYFVDADGRVMFAAAGELDPDGLEGALTVLEELGATDQA